MTTHTAPTPSLRAAGYVPIAPACGDCQHGQHDKGNAPFCSLHVAPVADDGRCVQWQPSALWLRANPQVAAYYPIAPSPVGLSPAEVPYLSRPHTLP